MRPGAAFLAGLLLGAAGAWYVAAGRVLSVAPAPAAATTPAAAGSPAAGPAASPSAPPGTGAGTGETTFAPDASPASPVLGAAGPGAPSAAGGPMPWAPSPEPEPPLGAHAASPVPGDSTDGLMTPGALVPPADAPSVPSVSDLDRLRAKQLLLPVQGYDLRQLRDDFAEKRGTRVHEAIDMAAPRGTPVLAVDDGTVKKLFTSAAGGTTIYEFDGTGTYSYYYAHLDRYAEGLREGQAVKKGDRLGYVGTSGNAPPNTPHLHFTIFKLAPGKRWWEGTPMDPYPLWALRR